MDLDTEILRCNRNYYCSLSSVNECSCLPHDKTIGNNKMFDFVEMGKNQYLCFHDNSHSCYLYKDLVLREKALPLKKVLNSAIFQRIFSLQSQFILNQQNKSKLSQALHTHMTTCFSWIDDAAFYWLSYNCFFTKCPPPTRIQISCTRTKQRKSNYKFYGISTTTFPCFSRFYLCRAIRKLALQSRANIFGIFLVSSFVFFPVFFVGVYFCLNSIQKFFQFCPHFLHPSHSFHFGGWCVFVSVRVFRLQFNFRLTVSVANWLCMLISSR